MRQSNSRRAVRTAAHPAAGEQTVCVVDPQQSDYESWTALAAARGAQIEIEFVTSAAAALRVARERQVSLWVISTALPDRSGCELCGMLRQHAPGGAIYLVADDYSPELERAAWAARPTLFCCKPGHRELLAAWLDDRLAATSSHSKSTLAALPI